MSTETQDAEAPAAAAEPATSSNAVKPADAKTAAPVPAKPKKKARRRVILLVLLAAALSGGAYEGHAWWTHGRFIETTDDAYVNADITVILSKVSGYVSSVERDDNAYVKAGDVLFRIDDGDYRLAVEAARNSLASAKATVDRISDQIKAGEVSISEAQAGLLAAQAAKEDTDLTYERRSKLTVNNVVSQASLDSARTAQKSADANVQKAAAAIDLAKANVEVLKSQKQEAVQAVKAAETALEKAKRDLGFTIVRAPVDGILGNRAAQVGSFLQAGSRVAAIVPISEAHVDANFKETQLGKIYPGAEVSMSVDAYPGQVLTGRVKSISPATGSVFSLLPSENATGNFTKVVQRVPVKIEVDPDDARTHPLRAGMSVIVEVDTRTGSPASDGAELALRQ
ncbi:HlyD family efflux transporter periplasmic adaptor subunit [Roseibium aggregatum]|uniref:HlyD family efflux transporter periplasmic adaptor subunit n=1 Tax=Roseibium aggregatum TaxID=187304 RepID=UPI001AD8BA72|nr:HlyD family secretion protein [Roseibium aggregatum]